MTRPGRMLLTATLVSFLAMLCLFVSIYTYFQLFRHCWLRSVCKQNVKYGILGKTHVFYACILRKLSITYRIQVFYFITCQLLCILQAKSIRSDKPPYYLQALEYRQNRRVDYFNSMMQSFRWPLLSYSHTN